MKCSNCNSDMKRTHLGGVTIYECLDCRSMWFGGKEFDDVTSELLPEAIWPDVDFWKKDLPVEYKEGSFACPQCNNKSLILLKEDLYKSEFGICENCKGIWIPEGQLLYLINALLENTHQKTVSEYIKLSLHQAKEILTTSGNPISEWQDLKKVLRMLQYRVLIEHPKLKSIIEGLQKSLPS